MLKELHIHNFVIIDDLKVSFENGLNLITGETGAGKSILLRALSFIMGKRADTDVLFDKSKKCTIEGVFNTSHLKSFFEGHDIDFYEEAIIRREISGSGRSRAFINDTPVLLNVLQDLSEKLIEVHQQFDQLEIRKSEYQLALVDIMAGHQSKLIEYRNHYEKWNQKIKLLNEIKLKNTENQSKVDYLQFQFNELEQANIEEDEVEELTSKLSSLTQAEDIKSTLAQAEALLNRSESGYTDKVQELIYELQKYSGNQEISAFAERLNSVLIELQDISAEINSFNANLEYDEAEIRKMENRLDILQRLLHKHHVQSTQDLILLNQKIEEELEEISGGERKVEDLVAEIDEIEKSLRKQATKLSENRIAIAKKLSKDVTTTLRSLGMEKAKFDIEINVEKELNKNGQDRCQFLFSANEGITAAPLQKVASGGEISRLNLTIKSLVVNKIKLPTMVFDEIDAGVSGETAHRIGLLLERISKTQQIICITHSPQIATKNGRHFHINKQSTNGRTTSTISVLSDDNRTLEIAKMLDGDPPGEEAIINARALLTKKTST